MYTSETMRKKEINNLNKWLDEINDSKKHINLFPKDNEEKKEKNWSKIMVDHHNELFPIDAIPYSYFEEKKEKHKENAELIIFDDNYFKGLKSKFGPEKLRSNADDYNEGYESNLIIHTILMHILNESKKRSKSVNYECQTSFISINPYVDYKIIEILKKIGFKVDISNNVLFKRIDLELTWFKDAYID